MNFFFNSQYTPLLDPRNKGAVHHMILYECVHSRAHQIFARYVAHEGAACYSPKMPVDWENCLTPIVAWAVGSEGRKTFLLASA
jgi:Copper type II ascorbate-dependent monooxygenase, N-terminal domain